MLLLSPHEFELLIQKVHVTTELLFGKLVTSQLKYQTWRATWQVMRSVIEFREFSESKKR